MLTSRSAVRAPKRAMTWAATGPARTRAPVTGRPPGWAERFTDTGGASITYEYLADRGAGRLAARSLAAGVKLANDRQGQDSDFGKP
jgi:hypothetical protein